MPRPYRQRHGDVVDRGRSDRHRRRRGELHGEPVRHAAGGETATIELAIADIDTTSATMPTFVTAVRARSAPHRSEL